MGMGFELARAFVRIRGDAASIPGDIQPVHDELDKVGDEAERMSNRVNKSNEKVRSSFKDISAGIASVTGAFARMGMHVLKTGLRGAASMEDMRVSMETTLGSADDAKATLANLRDFAVKTPFTMPGIMSVANQMIGFGERGSELMDTMNILADASGGTSEKFNILGLVLNQIRGVGHLVTQDFRQLSTRGIISLQDLADHFKVSTAEAQKMLSSGKISFDEFRSMLKGLTEEGGRYHNMSLKQSRTLNGLISTYEDARDMLYGLIATPLIPWAKTVLDVAIKLLDKIDQFVQNGGRAVSLAFTGATGFAALASSIFGVGFAMKFLGITTKGFLIGSGIGVIIIAFGALVGWLIAKWEEFSKVVDGVASNPGFQAIKDWAEDAYVLFDRFYWDNTSKFRQMWYFIREVFANLAEVVKSYVRIVLGLFGFSTDRIVHDVLSVAQGWIDSIHSMLDRLSLFTTNWTLTWEYFKASVKLAFLEMLMNAYTFFTSIPEKAMAMATSIWDMMKKVATGIGMGLVGVFTSLWQAVKNIAHNIGVEFTIVVRVITGLFKGLWQGIKSKFSGGSFTQGFADAFNSELAKAQGEFRNVLPDMTGAFSKGFDFVDNFSLQGAIDNLRKEKEDLLDQMRGERQEKRDADVPFFDVEKAFADMKPKAKEVGKAMGDAATLSLKFGRFGFAEIGKNIQDSMLGKEKNSIALAEKQVSIGELGLKKQDEMITAIKDIAPAGLT